MLRCISKTTDRWILFLFQNSQPVSFDWGAKTIDNKVIIEMCVFLLLIFDAVFLCSQCTLSFNNYSFASLIITCYAMLG